MICAHDILFRQFVRVAGPRRYPREVRLLVRPAWRALTWATVGCLVTVLLTGCGRQSRTVPVGGMVTLDGKPLADAAVLFVPIDGGVPGRGSTTVSGSFSLSTFDRNDGALVGRHRVAVSKVETSGFAGSSDGLSGKLDGRQIQTKCLCPERYGLPATSGLEVAVERGRKNTFELHLTSD